MHVLDHLHRALSPSRSVLAAVGAVAVLVGLAGGAAAVDLHTSPAGVMDAQPRAVPTDEPQRDAAPRTDGFDAATCLSPAPAPQTAATDPSHTVVSFVVTGRTIITVDAAGRPVSVATNTLQAPCITDTFVRVAPDGTATLADPTLRDAVLSVDFGGAWQPGVPEPFPAR